MLVVVLEMLAAVLEMLVVVLEMLAAVLEMLAAVLEMLVVVLEMLAAVLETLVVVVEAWDVLVLVAPWKVLKKHSGVSRMSTKNLIYVDITANIVDVVVDGDAPPTPWRIHRGISWRDRPRILSGL